MNAVLYLHFHVEDLMFYHLLMVVAIFVANKQGKRLFFIPEAIIFVESCLLLDELNLIASDI